MKFPADECLSLGAAPSLNALLHSESFVDPVVFLRKDELHWKATFGEFGTVSGRVLFNTSLEVPGASDVVGPV